MSDSSWSNSFNVPWISSYDYLADKGGFAGVTVSMILYGIAVVQFFQCMSVLLNRTRRDIKWGLVVHTVSMFLCVTINITGNLYVQSTTYPDPLKFPGIIPIPPAPIEVAANLFHPPYYAMFYLNQWLADSLLFYRFCVIFAMNYWFIALPCLIYLASVAFGIVVVYDSLREYFVFLGPPLLSFHVISVSLNVLLTLMIVIRLILHKRDIRNAVGTAHKPGGLYDAVVTMLVESCALYAITYLLYIVTWVIDNPAQGMFYPLLTVTQVIGQYLIIQRVANRTALTGDAISGNVSSIRFGSRGESAVCDEIPPDGDPMGSVDADGETPRELGIWVESIEEIASAR